MRFVLGFAVLALTAACGTSNRDDFTPVAWDGGNRTSVRDGGETSSPRDAGPNGGGEVCSSFDNLQTCMCGPGQTCGAWSTGCMCIGDIVDAGFRDGGTTNPPRDSGTTNPPRDSGTTNPPPRDGGSNPPRDGGVGPRRDAGPPPTGVPVYNGTCPQFVNLGGNPNAWNYNTLQSSGEARQFLLLTPSNPNPTNARVVFTYHWWMGQADWAIDWMGLQNLSNTYVVSPVTGPGSGNQWTNNDVQLFDDILACMYENFSIDPDRVFVTGHSMGALFISQLVQLRAQYIAGFVPLSGGDNTPNVTPSWPINGLLLWGGPTDTYGNFSFESASNALSQQFRSNGSFIMHCVGNFGHQLPPGPNLLSTSVLPFYDNHVRGQASPWVGGLPSGMFPSECYVP